MCIAENSRLQHLHIGWNNELILQTRLGKAVLSQIGYAVGQIEVFQIPTAAEGLNSDGINGLGENYLFQIGIALESP